MGERLNRTQEVGSSNLLNSITSEIAPRLVAEGLSLGAEGQVTMYAPKDEPSVTMCAPKGEMFLYQQAVTKECFCCNITVLDGELAVPCNPESAIPGSNSHPRPKVVCVFGASGVEGWVPHNRRSPNPARTGR